MGSKMDVIYAKAREAKKTIVLPEGHDLRVIKAASEALAKGFARPVLLADPEVTKKIAAENSIDISGIEIIDPAKSPKRDQYAATLYDLRKKKGMTEEEAYKLAGSSLYYGVLMVKAGDADGEVSGATHSTADTVRPALQVLKTAPGTPIVSSFFIMVVPNCELGEDGLFIFSDCGLVINPSAEELAVIAISSGKTMKSLLGVEPRIAMLSFSSKGSGKDALVDKVSEATRIAQENAPDMLIDGELQADSALVPFVAESKAPGSPVAGKANVLIFPDLQAGNIGYKLVERLAKADAYGPILQGIAKPVNDLSRGCSADDIVNVIAITAVQATQ
jgi:phosphate acetyltransferase